jgi:hypothetical protein
MVTAGIDEVGARAREEVQAVLSLVARSHGLASFPLPSGEEADLLDVEQAVNVLEDPVHLPPPAKLELIAELLRTGAPRGQFQLGRLAGSLVSEEIDGPQRLSAVDRLLERAGRAERGRDAFGRTAEDLHAPEDLFQLFHEQIVATRLLVLPMCEAGVQDVDGHTALVVKTTLDTIDRADDYSSIVDPRQWPECPIQSIFFKEMDPVTPPRPAALGDPDTGEALTLREVVDFSYGFDPTTESLMTTDLTFVYFNNDAAPVGCTYDLAHSYGNKVTVDQGYLLVEDLESLRVRRFTTLKQVAFTDRPQQPSGLVCLVWSIMQALIVASCVTRGLR